MRAAPLQHPCATPHISTTHASSYHQTPRDCQERWHYHLSPLLDSKTDGGMGGANPVGMYPHPQAKHHGAHSGAPLGPMHTATRAAHAHAQKAARAHAHAHATSMQAHGLAGSHHALTTAQATAHAGAGNPAVTVAVAAGNGQDPTENDPRAQDADRSARLRLMAHANLQAPGGNPGMPGTDRSQPAGGSPYGAGRSQSDGTAAGMGQRESELMMESEHGKILEHKCR
jgi:hypothetical protein